MSLKEDEIEDENGKFSKYQCDGENEKYENFCGKKDSHFIFTLYIKPFSYSIDVFLFFVSCY